MTAKRARKKAVQPSPKRASAARRQWNALAPTGDFAALVERVVAIIEDARSRVVRTVNSEMVLSYWHIGREIVEYVQRGESRAEYGEQVIEDLSAQLLARVGRGYSTRNLWYFRDFYLTYRERAPSIRAEVFRTSLVQNSKPIDAAKILHEAGAEFARGFSSRLSWTHYRALLKVSDPAARAFYEIEAERENWSTPHLERQIFTALHLRLLKSRNKAGVMELARKGQTVERPSDLIKSPLILDFLGLSGRHEYRESDLETAIISKLSQFLLELGKGFAFVARQKRISFDDDHLFIDLVFYNILLKCYLLIDLKLRRLTHQDVGQMDSYVRIFDAHERAPGDGPTIGLILCAEENHTIARYSVLNEYKQLFAAKYLTYLPTEEELRRELERDRRLAEASVEPPREEKPTKPKRATRAKGRRK
jgi:predicted nuclease of restriction endonuclease-like (RecB) superfamily